MICSASRRLGFAAILAHVGCVGPAPGQDSQAIIGGTIDTGDVSVPPAINALPWIDRFESQLALLRITETTGGDHNTTPNSATHAAATIAFLQEVLIPYEEPSSIVATKISNAQVLLDGAWVPVRMV